MNIKAKLNEAQNELNSIIQEINSAKKQIQELNIKGEQLTARGNFVRGQIETLQSLVEEEKNEV